MKYYYLFFVLSFFFLSCEKAVIDDENVIDEEMASEVDSDISSYSSINSEYKDVDALKAIFTLGHASDVHSFNLKAVDNLNEFLSFFQRDNMAQRIDALVITGDLCNGNAGRSKSQTIKELQSVTEPVLKQNIPTLLVVGNHDSNVNETRSNPAQDDNSYTRALTKREQYNYIIKDVKEKWNFINDLSEACYYYTDFFPYKIRMICLDFIDYPVIPNPNQSDKLNYNARHIFSQRQLEWFYKTLKSTPDDFGVIVAIHSIPGQENLYGKWMQGTNMMLRVVNAFKTGTQYKHDWDGGEYPELATSVDFDFTGKGESEFICWIGGHTHYRIYTKEFDQLMISTAALYTQYYDTMTDSRPRTYRQIDTDTQNSFNIMQVNREAKEVIVTVYGAYIDTQGSIAQRTTKLSY